MKIEIIVYIYLAVCLAMIGFNIVCVFLFSRNDRETEQSRLYYIDLIKAQFGREVLEDRHRLMLLKKLTRVRELVAFDQSLEILYKDHPEEIYTYLRKLESVFVALANRYSRKNEIQMTYFPYIIARYRLFYGEDLPQINREHLSDYSLNIQLAILDYIRFSSPDFQERMYRLLLEDRNSEIHFCAIRYLGRYPYQPAYEQLLKYAEHEDEMRWEYTSITCFSLASYPGERTIAALKKDLSSHNWYVRLNASQALEKLGLEYADFVDIFEGDDRYAGEMMRYRFDRQKLMERKAEAT